MTKTKAKTKSPKKEKVSYPTLNWCYGAQTPIANLQLVDEQILRTHRYKNKLVKIERRRREAADRTIRALSPVYDEKMREADAAEEVVKGIRKRLKLRRAKAQRRLDLSSEEAAELRKAKADLKRIWDATKLERARAYDLLNERRAVYLPIATEAVRAELGAGPDEVPDKEVKRKLLDLLAGVEVVKNVFLDAGDWVASEATRQARRGSNLYSGNYVIAERAFKNVRKGPPPVFKSYDGSGSIGVQIPGGMSLRDAIEGKNNLFRLELPELSERMAMRGKDRGRRAIGYAYLRVVSDGRDPVWAKIPFVYSRQIPEDARIQFAVLDRKRVGTVYHWQLRLEIRTSYRRISRPGTGRRIAVHLGYRLFENGVRVAVTLDDEGRRESLFIPNKLLDRFLYVDNLKSIQKQQFNLARDAFWAWRKTLRSAPGWFLEESDRAYNWLDTGRLSHLVLRWEQGRFEGDTAMHPSLTLLKEWADSREPCSSRAMQDTETAFGLFRYWTSWNRHMVDWIANQHRKPAVTRNQLYRSFALNLRKEYDEVIIAKVDWKKLAEQEAPEDVVVQTNVQRRLARIASPGRLSLFLQERFAGDVLEVPYEKMTKVCHICGDEQEWDRRKLMHQCTACGNTWDQDVNAVNNQMKRSKGK